jgi:hypothetical protein
MLPASEKTSAAGDCPDQPLGAAQKPASSSRKRQSEPRRPRQYARRVRRRTGAVLDFESVFAAMRTLPPVAPVLLSDTEYAHELCRMYHMSFSASYSFQTLTGMLLHSDDRVEARAYPTAGDVQVQAACAL